MRLGARPALRAVGLRRAARDVVVFACAVIASAGPGPLAPVPAAFAAPISSYDAPGMSSVDRVTFR